MGSKYLKRHEALRFLRTLQEWIAFINRDFASPSPNHIKMRTLVSHSLLNGTWVETGTYMGGTTKFLAKRFPRVISLEPSPFHFEYSVERLRRLKNVSLLNGTSEDLFESAFVSASPIANIWLDGHFSEGSTFLGSNVTPVIDELKVISKHKENFVQLIVFIDDIRLFPRSKDDETGYPPIYLLFEWCEKNHFEWKIENDILICKYSKKN